MKNFSIKSQQPDKDKALVKLLIDFAEYAEKFLKFEEPVSIDLSYDAKDKNNMLGMTGLYDPSKKNITIYCSGRHPKDILRSLSHELVHHSQNCKKKLNNLDYQVNLSNKDSKEVEAEAYMLGNGFLVRYFTQDAKNNNRSYLFEDTTNNKVDLSIIFNTRR